MSLESKIIEQLLAQPRTEKQLKKYLGNNRRVSSILLRLVQTGKVLEKEGTYSLENTVYSLGAKRPAAKNAAAKTSPNIAEGGAPKATRFDSFSAGVRKVAPAPRSGKGEQAVNRADRAQRPLPQKVLGGKKQNTVLCEIVKLSKGFGFAKPLDGGADVFIPGHSLMGAMVGDEVSVAVSRGTRRPGLDEGQVVAVTKEQNEFVGTLFESRGGFYVSADKSPAVYISVRQSAGIGGAKGDKVAFYLVKRGMNHYEHEAKINLVFGPSSRAAQCCEAILYDADIERYFPKPVLDEAERIEAAGISEQDKKGRKNLTDDIIFTIDSDKTKDIDDAISLKRTPQGYVLGVHIADVSNYVTAGSPLDTDAMRRGTSVYYANSVVPMLPKALSNGICSLNEGVERLAFSCFITLDESGAMQDYGFAKTVIKSAVKGVYAEINSLFAGAATPAISAKYARVSETLQTMRELYEKLVVLRIARGSTDIETGESQIIVDDQGVAVDVVKRERGLSEQMIEEFMLLANGAAAKFGSKRGMPFLYRIHEEPDPIRVDKLTQLLEILGIKREFEQEIPKTYELAKLLDDTRGTPLERAVHINVLRTMSKARYSHVAVGHYGLALADYAHFTSPIRRYPDLAIHRIMSDAIGGAGDDELIAKYAVFAQDAAKLSSIAEVNAVTAERACEDCYRAEYMRQFIGSTFTATIAAVTNSGLFVALPNTVEGLVPEASLTKGKLDITSGIQAVDALSGKRYKVGDDIEVTVVACDVAQGRVNFEPAV